ncbi:MFS transporter [Athalassotoga saccharophila]|uniref:MFS transporter n=1 Tax=Athalassotoga saccharophila TaxID=1441386 RepID=UPI00137A0558|nr:MFS transporter [Athalassotoga saccharophila]BBJ28559.1 multidrug resistance protein MdtH [Athalassotoga saccharophila]
MDRKKKALIFIILLGVVSFFADMTHESARSINGPFMSMLGASALAVGLAGGLGEFVGYALRFITGYFVDRTKSYWLLTIIGYAINLFAVPLMAIAWNWQIAFALIIIERFGKAFKNPPRDVMLSFATNEVGRGKGFGLHKLIDQAGAVIGPLFVALVLFIKPNDYKLGYTFLLIPAIAAMIVLFISMAHYPEPTEMEEEKEIERPKKENSGILNKKFWIYSVFVTLTMMGFAHFMIISYHFSKNSIISDAMIPVIFAVAMVTEGISAFLIGRIYDKIGFKSLLLIPILAILTTPFVFAFGYTLAVVGMILWGIVLGIQDTVLRASIADLIPTSSRGKAYGLFNIFYGAAWLAGSTIMGALYDVSILYVVIFSIVLEALSIPFMTYLWRTAKS